MNLASTSIRNWDGMVLVSEDHPQAEAYHKSYARTRKQLREDLRSAKTLHSEACALCFTFGPLKRCGKCKLVSYCSRECQKKDWALHKTACSKVEESELHLTKILQTFTTDPFLCAQLQTMAVLACNLVKLPTTRKPWLVRVDVGIEPIDMAKLADVFFGHPVRTPMPGMVQPVRDLLDAKGRDDVSIGLLHMSKGNRLSNLVPFAIERIIIDRVVGMGMKMESHDPVTGKVTMVPLTIDNILRFTNNHIRLDRDNNLGLRTTMTETELQVIRNATRQDVAAEEGERGDFASLLLKRKLLTVPEYKKYFASPS